ncbi:MAG: cell division transport system permease protein [Thermosediminibacterales bacterium]|nr:cell division transport system permease protein [Thermosediminibacterales bacterium]MDK2836164.1 cell division transport system permease protein [Thermosediminibacterales bacterium]
MRVRTFGYFFRQAVVSILRNSLMSFASVSSVAAVLIILGMVLLLGLNVDYIASDIESQVEITAYLADGLDVKQVSEIGQKLIQVKGIKEVKFVSKDEALKEFKKQLGDQGDLLEGIKEDNPLPDFYRIKTINPSDISEVAAELDNIEGIVDIVYGKEVVDKLFKLTGWTRLIGLATITIFAFVSIFIISNTIRLTVFARRKEIGIMKYIGATEWFIRWPFLIEGMLLGLIGALISVSVINISYYYLTKTVAQSLPVIKLIPFDSLLYKITVGFMAIGALLGALGSGISIRRFVKV